MEIVKKKNKNKKLNQVEQEQGGKKTADCLPIRRY